ncbi:MAG TPA: DNA ligase, partial [Anaeromyxobacteraceae bacterium]|nr:DNA ligase [Anaeromyxobacteraceae bacterium]
KRRVGAAGEKPMIAEARDTPFSSEDWLFELAYDGYRLVGRRDGTAATLRYRSGVDATALWPEIVTALETLPVDDAVLDGELVVLDPDGRPSPEALEERARLAGAAEIAAAAVRTPATWWVFDVLGLGGLDLRPLALRDRKRILERLVPKLGPIRYADHLEGRGADLFGEVASRGLPGVVAKRAAAPYRSGPSPDWREIRAARREREAPRPHGAAGEPPAPGPSPAGADRNVRVTNAEKIYFPGEGITKGELVAYHRAIAPWMLPWLKDRPLVLTRYPDGIEGKSFFQKDAPKWRPDWIRTVRVHSEDADRDLDHFLVDDADGLAWIVNMGTIPIHVWSSRADALERPDWCIVDLDPKDAPFADVVVLARAVHALCERIGLPSYPKTTGQRGLHVLVPVGGQLTHAQSRTLGELLARAIEARHPDLSTTARHLSARGGRVYLDFLQNGYGKT